MAGGERKAWGVSPHFQVRTANLLVSVLWQWKTGVISADSNPRLGQTHFLSDFPDRFAKTSSLASGFEVCLLGSLGRYADAPGLQGGD